MFIQSSRTSACLCSDALVDHCGGWLHILSSQVFVGQPLPRDLRECQFEAVEIVHIFSIVVAECLLIQISEQVERLYTNIGSTDSAFQ